MKQEQLDGFRQLLIAQRTELVQLQAANKDAAETVRLDQSMVGRLSRMDAMQAQQMAKETMRRREIQLQNIDRALIRMDKGEFGYCLHCDEEIPLARLEFDPASTRCITCMER